MARQQGYGLHQHLYNNYQLLSEKIRKKGNPKNRALHNMKNPSSLSHLPTPVDRKTKEIKENPLMLI